MEGGRLLDLDEVRTGILQDHYKTFAGHEAFWLKRLADLKPLRLSSVSSGVRSKSTTTFATLTGSLSDLREQVPRNNSNVAICKILLAAHLAYWGRLQENAVFDVGLVSERFLEPCVGLESLFSHMVPLRVPWTDKQTFQKWVELEECLFESHRGPLIVLRSPYQKLSSNSVWWKGDD